MKKKRIEIYLWWTCNQKCTYCVEYSTMVENWNKKIDKYEILKKLLKYKKLWYNHVTFLWWEPFIQVVFLDALKIAKKLWYIILVTTNSTTLQIKEQAEKYLPYIDELIISVQALSPKLQKQISRVNVYINWELVFENISNFWNWSFLKANIVITKDNLYELLNITKYLFKKWIFNISLSYPDIELWFYDKLHIINKIAPKYTECRDVIKQIINYSDLNNINLKLADIPLCIFVWENIDYLAQLSDDYNYENRLKINSIEEEQFRWIVKKVRDRSYISNCDICEYKNYCSWPWEEYIEIYWGDEINSIVK